MAIRITGGRVIDPAAGLDAVVDIYITEGRIQALGLVPEGFRAGSIVDARGRIVCPGLVDLRARLREPGYEHKATIASETRAAASAGITTLCCPPDTQPVIDTPAVVELIHRRAKDYELPCQISLEEYMACAVGGCAGCAVQVLTETGPVMKRICVDGPVFEAATVVF